MMKMGIYDLKKKEVVSVFEGNPYKINLAAAVRLSGAEIIEEKVVLAEKTYNVSDVVTIIL